MGKMVFTVLGAVAELERNIIRERVTAGLRRAKREGKERRRDRGCGCNLRMTRLMRSLLFKVRPLA